MAVEDETRSYLQYQ